MTSKMRKGTTPNNTTQNGETAMTEKTAPDYSAFADTIEDAPEEKIERLSGAGRPKQENPFFAVMQKARETGTVKQLRVPTTTLEGEKTPQHEKVMGLLRRAASDNGHGLRVKWDREPGDMARILFQAVDKKNTGSESVECPVCHNAVTVTNDNKIRVHGPRDLRCNGSGRPVEKPAA